MKRAILFRGKSNATNKWVEGGFTLDSIGNPRITTLDFSKSGLVFHEVIPETVGQFTGLTDKNGVKIFDGDVLLSESWGANARSKRKTHIVEWGRVGWLTSGYNGDIVVKPSLDVKSDWEVIGNIHDNKELLS